MCPALLNHGLPSVCLHPALFPLSPSGLRALQARLTKTLLSLTRTTQTLFWHVLPLSLSPSLSPSLSLSLRLPSSPLPPSSFHCFWEQFILPYLLLSYSFILAKPVSEPPSSLSLSILLVSKSPRGISDSLADLPLLLLKAGWLNFSFTFL